MDWKEKAVHLLNNSLSPVPTEHNELDWKSGISCNVNLTLNCIINPQFLL